MHMKQCFGKRTTFIMMMFLTTSFFFVEIIVGYLTNSMALVADSFHMLSDILSLFIGFFALRVSEFMFPIVSLFYMIAKFILQRLLSW